MAIDKGIVFVNQFSSRRIRSWRKTLIPLLDRCGLAERIDRPRILIKPNVVEAFDPPITTPAGLVSALIDYLQKRLPDVEIIIGEGTGSTDYDTFYPFKKLGYTEMAAKKDVELIDLNVEPLREMSDPNCRRWPEMALPKILFGSFLISVPVLKAHSLAGVTLTMKNMMGAAPPSRFQQGGSWKKAAFHEDIHPAIFDLNQYRTPDFTLLDATVGMAEAHLWGPTCSPPPNILAAGFDPVAIDSYGTGLLQKRWDTIGHIKMAHGVLGQAEPLTIIDVSVDEKNE